MSNLKRYQASNTSRFVRYTQAFPGAKSAKNHGQNCAFAIKTPQKAIFEAKIALSSSKSPKAANLGLTATSNP